MIQFLIKNKHFFKRAIDSDQYPTTKQYLKPTITNKVDIEAILRDDAIWEWMPSYLDKHKAITIAMLKFQGLLHCTFK